jgi:hypothetical protein
MPPRRLAAVRRDARAADDDARAADDDARAADDDARAADDDARAADDDDEVRGGAARAVRVDLRRGVRGTAREEPEDESQFMDHMRGPTSTTRFFARRSDLRMGVLDQSIRSAVDVGRVYDGDGDGDGAERDGDGDGAGRDDCGDGAGRVYDDGAGRDDCGDGAGRDDCDDDDAGRDDAERLATYALPDSYALCTFLNFAVARSRFAWDFVAYLSGWYLSASFLYARRTLFSVALSALTPRT